MTQEVRDIWLTLMCEAGDWDLVELCYERGLPWHPWAATTMIGFGFNDKFNKLKWMHAAGCPMDGPCAPLCTTHLARARAQQVRHYERAHTRFRRPLYTRACSLAACTALLRVRAHHVSRFTGRTMYEAILSGDLSLAQWIHDQRVVPGWTLFQIDEHHQEYFCDYDRFWFCLLYTSPSPRDS